jgi:hypothetical protein
MMHMLLAAAWYDGGKLPPRASPVSQKEPRKGQKDEQ